MNKSLVFKNKFYIFFSFVFSFFLFLYLFYFLINGQRGFVSFMKLKDLNYNYTEKLHSLNKQSIFLKDRITRLQPNTIDLDYLEEKLRKNTGFTKKSEIVVIFD